MRGKKQLNRLNKTDFSFCTFDISAGTKTEVLFVPEESKKGIYAPLKMEALLIEATLMQYRCLISLAVTIAMEITHIQVWMKIFFYFKAGMEL